MRERKPQDKLADILIATATVGILSSMLVVRARENDMAAKLAMLRANLKALRGALAAYRRDHGFYPCTAQDANRDADPVTFRRQLTWFTDIHGRVSPTRDSTFCYGPYLLAFPPNPLVSSGNVEKAMQVWIDTSGAGPSPSGSNALPNGTGWLYLPDKGEILPVPGAQRFAGRLPDRLVRARESSADKAAK